MDDGLQTPDNEQGKSRNSSKGVKSLLRSVFSTTSLSKSLEKLTNLGRSTSNSKITRGGMESSNLSTGSSRTIQTMNSLRNISESVGISGMSGALPLSPESPVHIVEFRRDAMWSYVLSNGYIGTYESHDSHYRLLYNKLDRLYFEIRDSEVRKVSLEVAAQNENIRSRAKHIESFMHRNVACEPFISYNRLVYLRKVFEVKFESLILFKFSNGYIQSVNYETNHSLLMADSWLILLKGDTSSPVRQSSKSIPPLTIVVDQ